MALFSMLPFPYQILIKLLLSVLKSLHLLLLSYLLSLTVSALLIFSSWLNLRLRLICLHLLSLAAPSLWNLLIADINTSSPWQLFKEYLSSFLS